MVKTKKQLSSEANENLSNEGLVFLSDHVFESERLYLFFVQPLLQKEQN